MMENDDFRRGQEFFLAHRLYRSHRTGDVAIRGRARPGSLNHHRNKGAARHSIIDSEVLNPRPKDKFSSLKRINVWHANVAVANAFRRISLRSRQCKGRPQISL